MKTNYKKKQDYLKKLRVQKKTIMAISASFITQKIAEDYLFLNFYGEDNSDYKFEFCPGQYGVAINRKGFGLGASNKKEIIERINKDIEFWQTN